MARTGFLRCAALLAAWLHAGGGCRADEVPAAPRPEWRIGAALQDPSGRERDSGGIAGLVILPLAPDGWMPRAMIGASWNLQGRTHHAHAGMLWRLSLTDRLFGEIGLGGAVHTGSVEGSAHRSGMGCPLAFRESLGLGLRLEGGWHAVATVEHLSNAGLCRRNRGLSNLTVGVGYSF